MMLQTDVLLIRDHEFYRQPGKRRPIYCAISAMRRRKPLSWYITLKRSLAYEQMTRISEFKEEIGMNAFFA
jgi:hypothetical protein